MDSTVYTLLRGILFLVPCFLLLPRAFGVYGLWLAIPAAELMTCTVISLRYILRNFSQRRAAWMVTNGKE